METDGLNEPFHPSAAPPFAEPQSGRRSRSRRRGSLPPGIAASLARLAGEDFDAEADDDE